MTTVRLGQVGTGTWGRVMLDAWSDHDLAQVIAVCDVDGDRARDVAAQYDIGAYYDNLEEFLQHPGLEAVGVATPDFAHREPVVRALEAGFHVLVQKPMASTVEDCQAMVAAQKRSGKHLMVDFQHRWGIGFASAYQAARASSFGRVVHGHIRMSNSRQVPLGQLAWSGQSNVLWFLGTHTADLARYIVGSEVVSVFSVSQYGVLRAAGVDTPDFFQTTLQFANGASIQMENSWIMPTGSFPAIEMKLDLYGEHESVRVQMYPNNIIVKSTADALEMPTDARFAITARGVSIRYFVEQLSKGEVPLVNGYDGLMNTAILVAIERSVAEGRVVQLSEVLS